METFTNKMDQGGDRIFKLKYNVEKLEHPNTDKDKIIIRCT